MIGSDQCIHLRCDTGLSYEHVVALSVIFSVRRDRGSCTLRPTIQSCAVTRNERRLIGRINIVDCQVRIAVGEAL